MKRVFVLWLCICLLSVTVAAAEAIYIHDDADLYTDAEEATLTSAAEGVLADSGLLCVLVTGYGLGDMTDALPAYAADAEDMVLLAIDMSARTFDLYQYNGSLGESAFQVSQSEADRILDGILPDMADGAYADAAAYFMELSETCFTNAESFSPDDRGDDYSYIDYGGDYDYDYGYDYDYDYDEPSFSLESVGHWFVIGLAVGGISVLCVWGLYKKKVHGAIYPLGQFAKLDLTDTKDTFITKNVVVTRIADDPPSHHGGGSRGGGRSHSGGSRGGGGARMGGRSF